MNRSVKPMILYAILMTANIVLLKNGVFEAKIFISLTLIFSFISLVIYFEDSIENFNLFGLKAKLKNIEEKTNAIAIKQVEPARTGVGYAMLPAFTSKGHDIDNETILVAKTIFDTEYAFRNFNGIVTDSQLPDEVVKDKIAELLNKKYINKFDIDGMELFALSANGRDIMFGHLKNKKPNKSLNTDPKHACL